MLGIMAFWLDKGLDGFRCDAVPYLYERTGTNCENLPETHAHLKEVRAWMDAHYEGRILLAEANQWPTDVRAYFGDGDEFHMAFHFPLMPRVFLAVRHADRRPITDIFLHTPEIPPACQWCLFLRNHDELTLAMVSEDERRMGDNISLGERNGVRTPMQWTGDRNAGFSRADPARLFLPLIVDPVYGYQAINIEAQLRTPNSLLNWMKRLIAVRRKTRVFGRGTLRFLLPANASVVAHVRSYDRATLLS